MTTRLQLLRRTILVATLLIGFLPHPAAYAAVACTATITPASATPTTAPTFDITVNNTGGTDIQWVDLSVLSANLSYNGSYISDWSASEHGNGITLNGNTIAAGASATFTLQAIIGLRTSTGNHWQAQVSDDPDGASPITCANTLDTAITGHPPNDADNGVSDIAATDITASSATITWSSDNANTGIVYYGPTSSYGGTSGYTPSLDNSHSVTLTGLSPGTTYHFQVAGDDGSWAFSYSGDNTFTTAASPASASSAAGGAAANVPGASLKSTPTETVPPTVALTTDLSHPFATAPAITGTASDNDGVAVIEYSTDGGANWQPVTAITAPNRRKPHDLVFSFTPVFSDDGNYRLEVRATDTSGNTATTMPATLVIDRLPPQTGPLVLAYGPQPLQPDATGIVNLVAGSDYRVTTSAIGGPTSLALDARPLSSSGSGGTSSAVFSLTQAAGTGLWGGTVSFKRSGAYQLIARGLDGAGNRSERPVMLINVLEPGRITGAHTTSPLAGAQIIVHYHEPASGTWQIWDGRAYHQTNPQTTDATGTYSLVVPRGTYYLEIKAPLHYSFISHIFTAARPQAITAPISLGTIPHLTLGPLTLALPNLVWHTHDLPAPVQTTVPATTSQLVGATLPDFSLPATDGTTQTALGLTGKPTLITILATWSPNSQAQIPQLAAAQSNPDINIVPIFADEHLPLVASYLDGAGYHLTALVDADGTLVKPLALGPAPEHIFIDSTGKIKKIKIGVLTKDELLLQLGGL